MKAINDFGVARTPHPRASHYDRNGGLRCQNVDRLRETGVSPHFKQLGISGNSFCLTVGDVRTFIENHPSLIFLGLVDWETPEERSYLDQMHAQYSTVEHVRSALEDNILQGPVTAPGVKLLLRCAHATPPERAAQKDDRYWVLCSRSIPGGSGLRVMVSLL
nr:hypothetical protein HmN_000728200 [Hymenolepis microstoma]